LSFLSFDQYTLYVLIIAYVIGIITLHDDTDYAKLPMHASNVHTLEPLIWPNPLQHVIYPQCNEYKQVCVYYRQISNTL